MSRSQPSDGPSLAHYAKGFRLLDTLGVVAFGVVVVWSLFRLAPHAADAPVLLVLALGFAWIAADFGSGVVHWAGDTWGTPHVPIVGPGFIRTFREHHVDQAAITQHDFVETNGANCLATLPVLLSGFAFEAEAVFGATFSLALGLWVFLTNQIHKWAHEANPAPLVRLLQRAGVFLRPEHHAIHHAAPHDRAYCITTGWLNPILDRTRFFRVLERAIARATGARVAREASQGS